jgi:hypothetical protein
MNQLTTTTIAPPSSPAKRETLTRRRLRAVAQVALALPPFAASLVALRYLVLGPHGVSLLGTLDGLFAFFGRDTERFFHGFSAHEAPKYAAHAVAVLLHVTGMSVALATGALQTTGAIRRRLRGAHRRIGWAYTVSATVGSVAGAFIAVKLPMIGGRATVLSNVLAGLLGCAFTWTAVANALRGDFALHGRWMRRSYAVLATLLTLYAMVFVFIALGIRTSTAYEAAHLLCLPFNLVAVEVLLWRSAQGPVRLNSDEGHPPRDERYAGQARNRAAR